MDAVRMESGRSSKDRSWRVFHQGSPIPLQPPRNEDREREGRETEIEREREREREISFKDCAEHLLCTGMCTPLASQIHTRSPSPAPPHPQEMVFGDWVFGRSFSFGKVRRLGSTHWDYCPDRKRP